MKLHLTAMSLLVAAAATMLTSCAKSDSERIEEIPTEASASTLVGHLITVDNDDPFIDINEIDHPVVLEFNAVWCGPCREFAPIYHAAAEKYADRADFYSIDVDRNPELALKYEVRSIPMMIVAVPGAKPYTKIGYTDADALDNILSSKL